MRAMDEGSFLVTQDYKVLLIGRSGSGKTTAIASVSEIPALSTEVMTTDHAITGKTNTTVGFDYGELTIPGGDNRMRLYGAPGQPRFDFMWNILERGSTGILLLADNHRPDPLEETRLYLRAFKSKFMQGSTVALLGIVKSDLSPFPSISQYQRLLKEEGLSMPVALLDARRQDSVLLVLKVLFRQLARVRIQEVIH